MLVALQQVPTGSGATPPCRDACVAEQMFGQERHHPACSTASTYSLASLVGHERSFEQDICCRDTMGTCRMSQASWRDTQMGSWGRRCRQGMAPASVACQRLARATAGAAPAETSKVHSCHEGL